jgi:hypothetical protein
VRNASDPERLRSAATRGSLLERGLTAARGRGPTDGELSALGASLFGGAAPGGLPFERTAGAGSRASTTAGSTGRRTIGLTKAAAALVVASAVAVVTTVGWHRTHAIQPEHQAPSPALASPATPSPPMALEERDAPAPPAPPAIPTPARSERLRPEPVAVSPRPRAIVLARQPAPLRSTAKQVGSQADEELVLLGRAQRALPKDPELALAFVREHEQRYPNGLLGEEREAVAVSALWEIGRRDEARRRAGRFAEEHPRSTYLGRMQRMLAPPVDGKTTDKEGEVSPSPVGGRK